MWAVCMIVQLWAGCSMGTKQQHNIWQPTHKMLQHKFLYRLMYDHYSRKWTSNSHVIFMFPGCFSISATARNTVVHLNDLSGCSSTAENWINVVFKPCSSLFCYTYKWNKILLFRKEVHSFFFITTTINLYKCVEHLVHIIDLAAAVIM